VNQSKPALRLRLLSLVLIAVIAIWAVVSIVRYVLPPPYLELAREAVAGGMFDEAVTQYEQHLIANPEDWEARAELGMVLAEFDRPGALVELRKIPLGTEASSDALRQIITICLASERSEEAEKTLLDLAKLMPADSWAQLTLAELYFRQSRSREALPYAQRAVELAPSQPGVNFLLAELLDNLNRPAEMTEPLEAELSLDPENYPSHLNLAYAYAEAGGAEKSGREARWCLARNPADVHARRFLAMTERANGNLEQAMREVQTALQVAPNDIECRMLETELLLFDGKFSTALERLEPLYEQNATDRRIVALLARAAAGAGKKELASKYREQVQKLSSP
jgi:tetratricopeptide (TPR) repeat protein